MNFTIINHQVVDEDSGEILGNAIENGTIVDKYAFEAVSETLSKIDSEIEAEERRLNAMIENQRKILNRKKGYRDYLHHCYTEPLRNYCAEQSEKFGSNTIRNIFATYSFRTIKGGVKLVDEEAALDAAKTFRGLKLKDCIKTTHKFQVSKLTEKQKEMIVKKQVPGFELTADEKRFYIKTAGSTNE
jgi:hypothetical protein